ncbi:hypothetical protein [Desulfolucanica intricata]|uniref:hypothetical protein n=1 Tax=Desulfolucanica intricata TaxID=1285191 RepID=UPI00082CDB14|nr:hypothetical protein [Desulfolucanica intricata]
MSGNRPLILLQKIDPVEVMDRLMSIAREQKAGSLCSDRLIKELLKEGEEHFLESEKITAVAVFSGQVSTSLSMQRTLGEEKFKFPSEINEGATKTRIVFEYNLRQWREVLGVCTMSMTHPRLKQVTIPILLKLKERLPLIFGDISYDEAFPEGDYGELTELN